MPAELDLVLVSEVDEAPPRAAAGPVVDYFTAVLRELPRDFPDDPPHAQQLSLAALGAWAREKGFRAACFDNVFRSAASREAFWRALERGPAVVGVSTSLMLEERTLAKIAGWVRERAPRALLLLGGKSAERRASFRALGDATVHGAGERPLEEVLRRVRAGRPLEGTPGLVLGERRVPAPEPPHPDELPAPAWDLFPERPSRCFSVEASKGCRYRCAFCSYEDRGRQVLRDPRRVAAELREASERWGARLFRFVDANLTSYPEWTEALCAEIAKAVPGAEWSCYARADNFARRPGLARVMARAGAVWTFLGVESGADAVLKRMRKGTTAEESLAGLRLARAAGLRVHANFIVGFPGETEATVAETLRFVEAAGPDTAAFFSFAVHEGSDAEVAASPGEWDLTGGGLDWSHPTMDSSRARALADRCVDEVCRRMPGTLIGSETLVVYQLMGCGFSSEEGLDYLRAVRAHRLASAAGDAAGRAAAESRLLAYRRRIAGAAGAPAGAAA